MLLAKLIENAFRLEQDDDPPTCNTGCGGPLADLVCPERFLNFLSCGFKTMYLGESICPLQRGLAHGAPLPRFTLLRCVQPSPGRK